RFLTHRNEFAFGIGGSTAFGKPFNGRWPENIDFAPAAAFYVSLVILVFLNRYPAGKSLVVGNGREFIFGPYFRIFCLGYQLVQKLKLYFMGVFDEQFHLVDTLLEEPGSYGVD